MGFAPGQAGSVDMVMATKDGKKKGSCELQAGMPLPRAEQAQQPAIVVSSRDWWRNYLPELGKIPHPSTGTLQALKLLHSLSSVHPPSGMRHKRYLSQPGSFNTLLDNLIRTSCLSRKPASFAPFFGPPLITQLPVYCAGRAQRPPAHRRTASVEAFRASTCRLGRSADSKRKMH